jgi:hypothetical protein
MKRSHRRGRRHSYLQWPLVVAVLLLLPAAVECLSFVHDRHKLIIFGLGRVGMQVAQTVNVSSSCKDTKMQVFGTVRRLDQDENCVSSESNAIQRLYIQDLELLEKHLTGRPDEQITPATHVLYTIPLSREQSEKDNANGSLWMIWDLIKQWWNGNNSGSNHHRVLAILSTTGVYGNHDGAVVTEESPLLCQPDSNAHLYKQFEDMWIQRAVEGDVSNNNRLYIFRCAGIYDGSSSALHTVFRLGYGESVASPSRRESKSTVAKTNRIHAADIARAVITAMFCQNELPKGTSFRIYNLADDEPESRDVVLKYANDLLLSIGVALPQNINKDLPTNMSKRRQSRRQQERKLVSNKRLKQELLLPNGLELEYPTYREGLKAILNDPHAPWHEKQCKETD